MCNSRKRSFRYNSLNKTTLLLNDLSTKFQNSLIWWVIIDKSRVSPASHITHFLFSDFRTVTQGASKQEGISGASKQEGISGASKQEGITGKA